MLSGATAATPGWIGSIAVPTQPSGPVGDWTVMVYITATDLASQAPANLVEMERAVAGFSDSARIVVLYDQWLNQDDQGRTFQEVMGGKVDPPYNFPTGGGTQPAWTTAGLAVIEPAPAAAMDGPAEDRPISTTFTLSDEEVDTGDAQTLTNFVQYAAMVAPAEHYALILWDHGSGSRMNFDWFDEVEESTLTPQAVASALAQSGVPLDLIAFDECLMSTVEGTYALRGNAPVVVASQEVVDGSGYDYAAALRILAGDPAGVDAAALGRSLVDAYQARYVGESDADTLAAIDTAGLDRLASALGTFVATTRQAAPRDWRELVRARAGTLDFSDGQYIDLGQFLARVAASNVARPIREAAAAAQAVLADVVFDKTGDSRSARGLSAYLPAPGTRPDDHYFSLVAGSGYEAATGWFGFTQAFATATRRFQAPRASEWAYNDLGRGSSFDLGVQTGARLSTPPIDAAPGQTRWYRIKTTQVGRAGDLIQAFAAPGSPPVATTVWAGGGSEAPVARGRQAVSLRGLPAGEYYVSVAVPRGPMGGRYALRIAAPRTPGVSPDLPGDNVDPATARRLGTVADSSLFSGLSRSATSGDAWYAFEIGRTQRSVEGGVSVLGEGQPLTLALYDEDGTLLGSDRGRARVHLPLDNLEPGEDFYLKVGGGKGAYSLFFGGTA